MTYKMKRLLVVSDNPSLVRFFMDECASQGVNSIANIKYHYSMVNSSPSAMIQLGAMPIDIKSPQIVEAVKNSYDLIFSIHCKQIFPADLVEAVTCINVHPGLNPYNRGWYPQVFSIINGESIGATIHLMDKEIDHGEIIDQVEVTVQSADTSADVYERVIGAEKILIAKNLKKIISGGYSTTKPRSEGNYNSIGDFRSLCKLNPDAMGTLRSHIDLLRALTHGEFKNAYYFDEQGRKIYIRVSLEYGE